MIFMPQSCYIIFPRHVLQCIILRPLHPCSVTHNFSSSRFGNILPICPLLRTCLAALPAVEDEPDGQVPGIAQAGGEAEQVCDG